MILVRTLLLALLVALAPAAHAQPFPAWDAVPLAMGKEKPDLVLTGTVTDKDHQRHVRVPFDVPEGVTRIGVEYDYTRPDGRTGINLGLFEGDNFRGWSGGNKKTVVIDETNATPSYLPGPVGGRRWSVDLGVSWISKGTTSDYTVRVWFWRAGDRPAVSTFSPEPLETGTRWYRGDLHVHTGHSDGFCNSRRGRKIPCPVSRTLDAAVDANLDFVAITEHNNVGAYQAMRALQPYYDDLLIVPGREMTTAQGHTNIFGTTRFVDYRLGSGALTDMAAVVARAKSDGALVSVNHPGSASNHRCRGCNWADTALYDRVDAVEVMTSNGIGRQQRGDTAGRDIVLWEEQIARGRRVTAIGGSDVHDVDKGRFGIGYPTTLVRANALSERAILDAIAAGHVMIDMTGRPGIGFDVQARLGDQTGTIGSNFVTRVGQNFTLSLTIEDAQNHALLGLIDGKPSKALSIARIADNRYTVSFTIPTDNKRHWIRFELRSGDTLLFMTNPIYLNYQ